MDEGFGTLTEAQVQALEKKKQDDEACGEGEAAHPGYLGSQDTFLCMRGHCQGELAVFISKHLLTHLFKVAFAKLYKTKAS